MESFLWAIMANSGTDPELEEEELEKAEAIRKEILNRELELRYLKKLDGEEDEEQNDKGLLEKMEQAEELLMKEPAVLDHYTPLWPPGEQPPKALEPTSQSPRSRPPSPIDRFHKTLSHAQHYINEVIPPNAVPYEDSKGEFILPYLPGHDSPPQYLIQIGSSSYDDYKKKKKKQEQEQTAEKRSKRSKQAGHPLPAGFCSDIKPSKYTQFPHLKMAFPRFPRNKFARAPTRKEAKFLPVAEHDRLMYAVNLKCCKPPNHPINGLYQASCHILNRHYNSLSGPCFHTIMEYERAFSQIH